ncbi:hypothetical protein [Aquisediminimonas sediminicola]|uniref:hypothetical protein n=1 Tax=Alteraquisediminimonas sediminicola TaxID=2676787 RepID=UPI001C8F031A|nr:hypothetical protein [Aquisediminimonas sediminicola]
MACCAFAVFLVAQIFFLAHKVRVFFFGATPEEAAVASSAVAWYPGQVSKNAVPTPRWYRRKWAMAAGGGFVLAGPLAAYAAMSGAPAAKASGLPFPITICGAQLSGG